MEPVSKKVLWTGRVLTALAAFPFLMSGAMKLGGGPQMSEGMAHFGWPATMTSTLAVLELGSVLIYLIPQTAVLGAIILTGYLGGALSTHLRLGENVVTHVIIGVLIWGGLYLRDTRLRALIPLRK